MYSLDSGVLCINKEATWTSHDVVALIRRRFKLKKVGHCGTLDPMATGLLIIVTGKATKFSSNFMNDVKTYKTQLSLGIETTTHDIWGEVVRQEDFSVTKEQVEETVQSFVGTTMQTPPMVSAIKQNGKRLYQLARQGIEVERKQREIHISSLKIANINLPQIDFEVTCSKGTYVRSLCYDIGVKLNTIACMSKLERTESGSFSLDKSYTPSEIKQWSYEDFIKKRIPLQEALETHASL